MSLMDNCSRRQLIRTLADSLVVAGFRVTPTAFVSGSPPPNLLKPRGAGVFTEKYY